MDDDLSLPKATIQKLVKEFIPGDVRVSSDAFDALVGCCTEFVQLMSSESNEIATKNQKCMVQPDHVMTALQELGFDEFKAGVTAAWDEQKEEAKAESTRKAAIKSKHAQNDLTEEQLIEMQKQMFAAARARSMTSEAEAASMAASYQAQLQAGEAAGSSAMPPPPPPQ
ncbi:hypothetical protein FOA52_015415 [Chlamydomonas sp. UWO 241]|nr:hypothetical protein FOA52_015415 [Chlamydomonas sp. UWO 241]